jgi:hypothetical protein
MFWLGVIRILCVRFAINFFLCDEVMRCWTSSKEQKLCHHNVLKAPHIAVHDKLFSQKPAHSFHSSCVLNEF